MDNKEILEEVLQWHNGTESSEITALIVNDYLNGEIVKTDARVNGRTISFYFNIIDGERVDMARNLPEDVKTYCTVTRDCILENPTTAENYRRVKEKIDSFIPCSGF